MNENDFYTYILKLKESDIPENIRGPFNRFLAKKSRFMDDRFQSFIAHLGLNSNNKEDLYKRLNTEILTLEKSITKNNSLTNILDFSKKFLPNEDGFFITEKAAAKIIKEDLAPYLTSELKSFKSPLTQLALIRYSLNDNQRNKIHQKYLNSLKNLSPSDFETRPINAITVKHDETSSIAQSIIERKCFNTHDKITGSHIISTLPKEFSLAGKAPFLRTFTKLVHYQKELLIFSQAFKQATQSDRFGDHISHMIENHFFNNSTAVFNVHDLIEGIANSEIDKSLASMSHDFPSLIPWVAVHNVMLVQNKSLYPLSLWRLISWQLSGKKEYTTQMLKDVLLIEFLLNDMSEENLIKALIEAQLNQQTDLRIESHPAIAVSSAF